MPSETRQAAVIVLVVGMLGGPPAAQGQYSVGRGGQLGLGEPTSLPAASSQLALMARELISTARAELAGSSLGRRLEIRANALYGAARSLDGAVRQGAGPEALLPILTDIEAASAQVRDALNAAPGAAPESTILAAQIDELIHHVRRMVGGGAPFPPIGGAPPVALDYDPGSVIQQAEAARAAASTAARSLAVEVGWVPPYDTAIRDLRGLSAQLTTLRDQARRQFPVETLQASWGPIRHQAASIAASLRGGAPPSVSGSLGAMQANLDALANSLGLSAAYVVPPHQPSILAPPAYGGLPYPVVPTTSYRPYQPPVLGLIDQALGEIDAFLLGIRPSLGTIPEGPRFQADAVALRNDVLDLRQRLLARDTGGSLSGAFSRVDRSYRRLAERTGRIAKGRYGPNIARIDTLGDVIGAILRESGRNPY